MTVAYFDCFAGAGGDMIVASLLDAGASLDALKEALATLQLEGYDLRLEQVNRCGLASSRFVVELAEDCRHPHRHLSDILELIDGAKLPDRATRRAKEVFTRLGRAEAQVHGVPVEKVHFHEVGAVDSICDIVGACVAMDLLDIHAVYSGPIPLGWGTMQCAHGLMPIPAPATAELVRGFSTVPGPREGELTTPTAAALLTTLSEEMGPCPAMRIETVGNGAGTREHPDVPNVLRVLLGRAQEESQTSDSVVELSANLDDCTGEILGSTIDRLLEAGCLDAWATPAVMKKTRPGYVLSVLCSRSDVQRAEEILFGETTTFGIRKHPCIRSKLSRRTETVETPFGPIRIKIGFEGENRRTASPEFEDCRQAARAHHVSVREVLAAAARAAENASE
jgi:hypothetical protein